MGRAAGASVMVPLLLVAPVPVIGVMDIISGDPGEPLLDYLVMYVFAVIVLSSAVAVILPYFRWKGLKTPVLLDLITYALAGGAGTTGFMIALDAWEDYFSWPGVGWIWPLTGLVLGSLFGATFRAICAMFENRS